MKHVYFITGASGVGKTTLVEEFRNKYKGEKKYEFGFLDKQEFKSLEIDDGEERPGGPLQKAKVYRWVEEVVESDNEIIILDGQVPLDFITEAFERVRFDNYTIIYFYCHPEVMEKRLIERKQPELFTPDMVNRNKFLFNQAREKGVRIIDTTNLGKREVLGEFEEIINNEEKLGKKL